MHLDTIKAAHQRIKSHIRKTPLVRAFAIEKHLTSKARIFLKCENLQWTNSFKVRGAFNATLALSKDQQKQGVITRSSGNFAQALAFAGSILHVPTTIIMPLDAPEIKKERTAYYGGKIILFGKDHTEQQRRVQEIAEKENLSIFSPYDHFDVIAGQGSIALEIFEQLPTIAKYICPIGGGGLMGGTSTAFKELNPLIEIIGVEPIGANDYCLSRKAGKPVRLEKINTIADGLRAPQVGKLNWPLLQKNVDKLQTVTDEKIKHAMRFLYEQMGLIIEPSGAISAALLLDAQDDLKEDGDIVCVISGGNVDLSLFYSWIESI